MNIGGVERSFLTLSNQLLEKGHNVSIITLNQSKNLLNYDNKIEIISLKTSRSLLSLFKLSKMISQKKPDILINNNFKISTDNLSKQLLTTIRDLI